MYFPLGWPKVLNIPKINGVPSCSIRQLVCNRDKILFVVLTDNSVLIYYCKPTLLIVVNQRSEESISDYGKNELVEWKPDSSALVVTTSSGCLLFYKVKVDSGAKGLYELVDPPEQNLRRDSAELFVKEVIPPLQVELEKEVYVGAPVASLTCLRDELMVSSHSGHIYRYRWDGSLSLDYSADLRRIPFCSDQHSRAIPLESGVWLSHIEYAPLCGGFAVVLSDGRAAFLTASCPRFDPNTLVGIWAPLDDTTCAAVNHKFRLLAFGRENAEGAVYCVDETTGALVESHRLAVPGQVFPGPVGPVRCARWSPDSCVLALAWESGGIAVWSAFGALLTCSLAWDYGLSVDLSLSNPFNVRSIDWAADGYQLWLVKVQGTESVTAEEDCVMHLNFVKSALTVNPCMSHQSHLYLQGEDKLYISSGTTFAKVFGSPRRPDLGEKGPLKSQIVDNKQWTVVQVPSAYLATNWPIRYSAIDSEGSKLAVAGRAGLAHYSMSTHKWKLFGNERQERDMVVTGGLVWWRRFVVAGVYNVTSDTDELRLYPSGTRLSDVHMTSICLSAQALLLDELHDRALVFTADARATLIALSEKDGAAVAVQIQAIDLTGLGVHPVCFVAATLFSLQTEASPTHPPSRDNFIINVSGRVLMVNMSDDDSQILEPPVGLASCVEIVWSPMRFSPAVPHLTQALWLFCGAHGMRVWLPLFPRDSAHTYMSKRIMLPFQLKIYPLAILLEDAILLGVENDTLLYSSDPNSPFSLPFCVLERSSQVYLHQVLRQLIKRNLGYHAWEIARCCTSLPYFPHSLELLLHEVLEEEATSKDPIPDALLPSVIEFIKEFPVYLDTVVQCARKTEIALWPYLFSVAGKPKDLFEDCLALEQLETAASYLIILQNLEPSTVSRQYATKLLDSALHDSRWDLSKELVRFLKAIDPKDAELGRSGPPTTPVFGLSGTKYGAPAGEEDLSLVMGTACRPRSFSTTVTPKIHPSDRGQQRSSVSEVRKKTSVASASESGPKGSAEEFFMDQMVERHARRLLVQHRLADLGRMAAIMDFPLVSWLGRERNRAAVVEDIVVAVKSIQEGFGWTTAGVAGTGTGDEEPPLSRTPAPAASDSGYVSCHFRPERRDDVSIASDADSNHYLEESGDWGVPWSEVASAGGQLLDAAAATIRVSGGIRKAEIQLRYLLQLLTDAGCLQWALAVAVTLGDGMAVSRITSAARSPDQNVEAVSRLRNDILTLAKWADGPTAQPPPHVALLDRVISAKKTAATISSPPSPSPLSSPHTSLPPLSPSADIILDAAQSTSCTVS